MNIRTPSMAQHSPLIDNLLVHVADVLGFPEACVLLEDGGHRTLSVFRKHGHVRVRSIPVDSPLLRGVVHGTGHIYVADPASEPSLFSASARILLIDLATPPPYPRALLLLNDSTVSSGAEPSVTEVETYRQLVSSAVIAALDVQHQQRRIRELEQGRTLAEERFTVVEQLDNAYVEMDTVAAAVQICAELAMKDVAVFDPAARVVAMSEYRSHMSRPEWSLMAPILDSLSVMGTSAGKPVVIDANALTSAGVNRRKIVTSVSGRGEMFGWLVFDETPGAFRPNDEYIAEKAAQRIAAQYVTQRRIARVADDTRSVLAQQLLHGYGALSDIDARAEHLGVNIAAKRVVVFVPVQTTDGRDFMPEVVEALESCLDTEILATQEASGWSLLIAVSDDATSTDTVEKTRVAVANALSVSDGGPHVAGVSSVCEPHQLRQGYDDARQIVRCIDRIGAREGVVTVFDLGPARLLIAHGDDNALQRYVAEVLGPLFGDRGEPELIQTMANWYAAGCNARVAAMALDVHENTVRARLARVHALTGFDVIGVSDDRFSVQTALTILRLKTPGLLSLASSAPGPDRTAPIP